MSSRHVVPLSAFSCFFRPLRRREEATPGDARRVLALHVPVGGIRREEASWGLLFFFFFYSRSTPLSTLLLLPSSIFLFPPDSASPLFPVLAQPHGESCNVRRPRAITDWNLDLTPPPPVLPFPSSILYPSLDQFLLLPLIPKCFC